MLIGLGIKSGKIKMQGPKWKKTKMQGLKVHLCLIIITTTTQTKKEKQYSTYAKNLKKKKKSISQNGDAQN